jgi:hypothetical protein
MALNPIVFTEKVVPFAPAEASPSYKVRVYSAKASNVVIVRVVVAEDGKSLAAETRMRTNEITPTGAYHPAEALSEIDDSPIRGLHVNAFDVGLMNEQGEIEGSERMTAIIHFDRHANVTFFFGVVSEDQGTGVLKSYLWGYPPGIQRDL